MLNMCLLGATWWQRGGFVGGLGSILEILRCAWGHLGGRGVSWNVLGVSLWRLVVGLGASWAIVKILAGFLGVPWGCPGDDWRLWGASCKLLGEFGSPLSKVNMHKSNLN